MNHSKKCKRIFQTNFAAEDMKLVIQLEEKGIYLRLFKRKTREYRGSRKYTYHNIREKWRQLTVSPTFSLTQSLRSPSVQRILGKYPPFDGRQIITITITMTMTMTVTMTMTMTMT